MPFTRSTDRSLVDAFAGEWQDRELVFEGAERPEVQFEVGFDAANDKLRTPVSYHLEVEFGKGRSCRRTDEWFEANEHTIINELSRGGPGSLGGPIWNQIRPGKISRFWPSGLEPPACIALTPK